MLEIAICDNEPATCETILENIHSYKKDKNIVANIEIFYTGMSFLERIEKHTFDIAFLEIEMKITNGIEIGQIIRKNLDNQEIQIIYLSTTKNYSASIFEVRPMNLLIKPIIKNDLYNSLDLLIHLQGNNLKFFEYKVNRSICKEKIENILYFEANARKVKMVTFSGDTFFYGSLKEIEKIFRGQSFQFIHNSYFINIEKVREFKYKKITMCNGDCLPISQKYRGHVAKC